MTRSDQQMDRLDHQMNRSRDQMDTQQTQFKDFTDHWMLKYIPVIIQIVSVIIIATAAAVAIPSKIMADVDCKYVRQDVHAVQQKAIEDKLDVMTSMIKDIARRVK